MIRIVKTWCENTKEGEDYLKYNGYKNAKRLFNSSYYVCFCKGIRLSDVDVIV